MRKLRTARMIAAQPVRPSFRIATPELDSSARLVGLGFRYWVLGRRTGNVACWERAWELYSGVFGVAGGREALTHLSSWVGALGAASSRPIEVEELPCRNFCRDECIAISMIAACQQGICPAIRACAYALVKTSHINGIVDEAQLFAATLVSLEHVLSPTCILQEPVNVVVPKGVVH